MICVYAVFITFSTFSYCPWLFWFSIRLKQIFQVHNTTISFSFVFSLFFSSFFLNGLLWAMSHVVDGLPAWSISSPMRIVLKGLAFGSRLFVSFLSRGYGSKVFPKNGQFSIMCPKTLIEMISGYHDLGILFCSCRLASHSRLVSRHFLRLHGQPRGCPAQPKDGFKQHEKRGPLV